MKYPDIIKEARARQRKVLFARLFKFIKIIMVAIIGITWDLHFSVYMESHYFLEDIQGFLIRYANTGITDVVAELIYWVMPWLCLYCLLYPVICYVESVGIKVLLF